MKEKKNGRSKRYRYSFEEKHKALVLMSAGLSVYQVSKLLGIKPETLRVWKVNHLSLVNMNSPYYKKAMAYKKDIEHDYEVGYSVYEICLRYDIPIEYVLYVLELLNEYKIINRWTAIPKNRPSRQGREERASYIHSRLKTLGWYSRGDIAIELDIGYDDIMYVLEFYGDRIRKKREGGFLWVYFEDFKRVWEELQNNEKLDTNP